MENMDTHVRCKGLSCKFVFFFDVEWSKKTGAVKSNDCPVLRRQSQAGKRTHFVPLQANQNNHFLHHISCLKRQPDL